MGSALAGAKAGAVATVYFAGSISLFNVLLLLAFKSQVLNYLQTTFTGCSGSGAQSCLTTLLLEVIPIEDLIRTAVLAILFAMAIGVYFDFLPGPTYMRRTLLGALIMLVAMLFLGVTGVVTSAVQEFLMIVFEAIAAFIYALILSRLYRRFTRQVEFQSVPPKGKVLVNRRDLTGRKRTFRLNSTAKVEAAGELKSFKGWLVSGGVVVSEPKEVKTSIRVNGDGLLKLA